MTVYVICDLLCSFIWCSFFCSSIFVLLSRKTEPQYISKCLLLCFSEMHDRQWRPNPRFWVNHLFQLQNMWSSVQCASGKSCHRTQTVEYLNIMTADTTWLNKLTVVASASFLNILFVNSVTPKDKYWDDMQCPPLFSQHYYSYMIVFNSCH